MDHLHQALTSMQSQRCDNACDIAPIKINEKIESLQNGVATHFGVTLLISMGTISQVSPQR